VRQKGREYGSGTYAKLGIDRRGLTIYKLKIDLPRAEGEARRTATKRVRCQPREVEAELARFRAAEGLCPAGSLGELLLEWLRAKEQSDLSPSTYAGYESIVSKHLIPALGDRQLRELAADPRILDDYLRHAATAGRKRVRGEDGKGLSDRTVHHHFAVLRSALRWAVKKRRIPAGLNPMPAVDAPQVADHEPDFLPAEDLLALAAGTYGGDLHAAVVLACYTGARRGEILALGWSDVDLEAGVAKVEHALVRVASTSSVKAPKSKAGIRHLELPAFVVGTLRGERARQQNKARSGEWKNVHDLVCPSPSGDYWIPGSFSAAYGKRVQALVNEKRVSKRVTFHGLRHSHATDLIYRGVLPGDVQRRLGHSKVSTTMDLYTHTLESAQRKLADGLESTTGEAFREALASCLVTGRSGEDGSAMVPARPAAKRQKGGLSR